MRVCCRFPQCASRFRRPGGHRRAVLVAGAVGATWRSRPQYRCHARHNSRARRHKPCCCSTLQRWGEGYIRGSTWLFTCIEPYPVHSECVLLVDDAFLRFQHSEKGHCALAVSHSVKPLSSFPHPQAYVNVSLQRVAAFVVGMRPFSDYTKARGSGFLMHPAVHWATEYCIHGILPKHMGWKSMTMQTLATASSAIVTPASAKSRRGGNKLKSSLEQDATVGLALRRSDTDDATAAHDLTGRAVVVAPVSREMDAQVAVVLASEHRTVTGITDSGWKRRKMVEPFYLVRYTTDPKHRTGPVYGMMGSRCVLGNRLLCALEPPLVDPGQSVSVWYMMS
eukprot:m.501928 g.501928  ORF g.501928 m.501928 type:complete len:337 (+) comp21842_c1_seq12:305-1315(+)